METQKCNESKKKSEKKYSLIERKKGLVMVNLDKLFLEVIEDVKSVGFPVVNVLQMVVIDNGVKDSFGTCHKYLSPEYYEIHLSDFMLKASVSEIKNVLAHEILHTSDNTMEHNETWCHFKDLMNKNLGYNIRTKCTIYDVFKK